MAYATLMDLRAYLSLSAGENGDDALLTSLIARSQAIIDSYTSRTFECATHYVRYFPLSAVDGKYLLLDYDLAAVTSIKNGDTSQTAITSGQYRLYPFNGAPKWAILLKDAYDWQFDSNDSLIEVDGTWCFHTVVPADIAHATIRLAGYLYHQKDNSADLDRPIVSGDGMSIMPTNLPKDVTAILKMYRRVI